MQPIAESDSIIELYRILPQHQTAITLINSLLQNPKQAQLAWLDLACGKGQIISQLKENLSEEYRNRITYHGYDINANSTQTALRIASKLNLQNYNFYHGDMSNFSIVINSEFKYDFITCTNVVHELHPNTFISIVLESLKRLTEYGQLFIYDMESLITPELGALPLRTYEIKALFDGIFKCLDVDFKVYPSEWSHSKCKGWTVILNRQHISIQNNSFDTCKTKITNCVNEIIKEILRKRYTECYQLLNTYTYCGTSTATDEQSKQTALYEFWAIHKAKELFGNE